jgi:streptogramin lyase
LKRLLFLVPALLLASSPATWEMSSFTEFVRGRFENVALSRGGQLSLAQRFDPVFTSTEPFLWTIATTPAGDIYAGTGNRGQLYRIDPAGKSSLIWTAPEPEIFAIVADPHGIIYAGTSPDGKIYRIENGKASVYFNPKSA